MMNQNQLDILRMISEGKLTAEEGQRLLEALETPREEPGDHYHWRPRERPPLDADPFEQAFDTTPQRITLTEDSHLQVRSDIGAITLLGTDGNDLVIEGTPRRHYRLSHDGQEVKIVARRLGAALVVRVPRTVSRVRVKSNVGEIAVRDLVCEELRAESDTGQVTVVLGEIHRGEIRLSSDVGELRLKLPASSACDIHAATNVMGEIRTNLPLEILEQAPGLLRGRLNGGGADIRLLTDVGQISIRALSDEDAAPEWSTGAAGPAAIGAQAEEFGRAMRQVGRAVADISRNMFGDTWRGSRDAWRNSRRHARRWWEAEMPANEAEEADEEAAEGADEESPWEEREARSTKPLTAAGTTVATEAAEQANGPAPSTSENEPADEVSTVLVAEGATAWIGEQVQGVAPTVLVAEGSTLHISSNSGTLTLVEGEDDDKLVVESSPTQRYNVAQHEGTVELTTASSGPGLRVHVPAAVARVVAVVYRGALVVQDLGGNRFRSEAHEGQPARWVWIRPEDEGDES